MSPCLSEVNLEQQPRSYEDASALIGVEAGSRTLVRIPEVPGDSCADIAHDLLECDREMLVRRLAAALRWHPHVGNVMTHICGSQWTKIEQALRVIVSPATMRADLSPLAQNIVDLMWMESGVTGRTLKPYMREFLARNLPRHAAAALRRHIASLCSASTPDRLESEGSASVGDRPATLRESARCTTTA